MTNNNKLQVSVIGSGNWGSSIATKVGVNCQKNSHIFHQQVNMWVYEEKIGDGLLSQIINERHENVKYLPGIALPENVVAEPQIAKCALADVLVICLPHQFLSGVLQQIQKVRAAQPPKKLIACSLIKGISIGENGPVLVSEIIKQHLKRGADHDMTCSVLCGANIATHVAKNHFCESTLGYSKQEDAEILRSIFETEYFKIQMVEEIPGVELLGALKNVVALASGLVEGLGAGESTRAALLRIGFSEMRRFIKFFYPNTNEEIFMLSAGVADLIATCFGGRNYKVSKQWGLRRKETTWKILEKEMLNGQKLQGTITCQEVHEILKKKDMIHEFPFFTMLYKIFFEGERMGDIFDMYRQKWHAKL